MSETRTAAWLMALLAVIVASPATFVLGIAGAGLWQALSGPAIRSGEGVQADAYGAFFIGGPVGLVVGSVLIGWLALRFAGRVSLPVRAGLIGLLAAASLFALRLLGSH